MAGERLRVLVADDHPVFRSGLRTTIAAMQGVEVVGEAATGLQAVALARQLRPDLVVMDRTCPSWMASRRPGASWSTIRWWQSWC